MKWIGIGLVQAWRHSFGLLTPSGTCKYHPSCDGAGYGWDIHAAPELEA